MRRFVEGWRTTTATTVCMLHHQDPVYCWQQMSGQGARGGGTLIMQSVDQRITSPATVVVRRSRQVLCTHVTASKRRHVTQWCGHWDWLTPRLHWLTQDCAADCTLSPSPLLHLSEPSYWKIVCLYVRARACTPPLCIILPRNCALNDDDDDF